MSETRQRYFSGLARGLGPDTIGAPVDAAEQFINLLIAGGGYAAHKAGLVKTPPELLRESPGTSDWWARKLGTPDDGSAAYTAGRLTPLAVGLAKPAAGGALRALDKGLAGPRPGGQQAQRGAIRVSRGPADQVDDELVLSHSMHQQLLPELATKSGSLELYSPSMGIKRRGVMTEFGDLALIPRVGAFDPAASPSTLFNRDAYTARHTDFAGKAASYALTPRETPLRYAGVDNADVLQRLLSGQIDPKNVAWHGSTLDKFDNIKPLFERFQTLSAQIGPKAAWERLTALDTDAFTADDFFNMGTLSNALDGRGGQDVARLMVPRDMRKEVGKRLTDRFALGSGIRPEDLRRNEGLGLGQGKLMEDPLHQMAIDASPAFRSFAAYEKSPLGAKLLKRGMVNEKLFQQKVMDKAFGDDFGWMGQQAQIEAMQDVPLGLDQMGKNLDLMNTELVNTYARNGFTVDDLRSDLPDLYRRAALARRAIGHTPSQYAELKVLGPVPVNRESFAGAILQADPEPETIQLLQRAGIPLIPRHDPEFRDMSDLEIVKRLQTGMGAAKRLPAY